MLGTQFIAEKIRKNARCNPTERLLATLGDRKMNAVVSLYRSTPLFYCASNVRVRTQSNFVRLWRLLLWQY